MNDQRLRDIIARRMDLHWPRFAEQHPNLAAAVERSMLIDSAVDSLADDPQFRAAMRRASVDDAVLDAAAKLLDLADRAIGRAMGI
jgi:hypothetical protein